MTENKYNYKKDIEQWEKKHKGFKYFFKDKETEEQYIYCSINPKK
jgi:hypothetical protein